MMWGSMAAISTAAELWERLVLDGGLQPSGWDKELVEALELRLGVGLRTPLKDLLKVTPVEELVLAILAELRPFGAMMADLLELFERHGVRHSDAFVAIEFDFGRQVRTTCTSTCVSSATPSVRFSTQPRPSDGGIGRKKRIGNCSKLSGGARRQRTRGCRIRPLRYGSTNGSRSAGRIEPWSRRRRAIVGWRIAWAKSGRFGGPSSRIVVRRSQTAAGSGFSALKL